jgi:tRNA 2-thiocytidine biosynthesis protein TtcA
MELGVPESRKGGALEKRLLAQVGRTSIEHRLIEPGDRILVAVSGGKDSHAMLYLLREIARRAPFEFSMIAVNLDQGHPGYPAETLRSYFEREGYEHRMLAQDTYRIVTEKIPAGKTYCSLCSRLRRGILYNAAVELGCNKIALGHHRDDTITTLLMNLLYAGQCKAMPPRLTSDDGRNIVIRPLIACEEADLAALAAEKGFPILPCDLCGSQPNLQRKRVGRLIEQLHAENPHVKSNLFAALANVRPSHLLDPHLRRTDESAGAPREAGCGDDWSSFGE